MSQAALHSSLGGPIIAGIKLRQCVLDRRLKDTRVPALPSLAAMSATGQRPPTAARLLVWNRSAEVEPWSCLFRMDVVAGATFSQSPL